MEAEVVVDLGQAHQELGDLVEVAMEFKTLTELVGKLILAVVLVDQL
jgi:hypothetical protein